MALSRHRQIHIDCFVVSQLLVHVLFLLDSGKVSSMIAVSSIMESSVPLL